MTTLSFAYHDGAAGFRSLNRALRRRVAIGVLCSISSARRLAAASHARAFSSLVKMGVLRS